jgi:hypothetical protein
MSGLLNREHFIIETEAEVVENFKSLIKITYKSEINNEPVSAWIEARSDIVLVPTTRRFRALPN